MATEKVVCAECGEEVKGPTAKKCLRYEELDGKIYCATHRDERLKKFGYDCARCGTIVSPSQRKSSEERYNQVLCYTCIRRSGTTPTTALATTEKMDIVKPLVDVGGAVAAWDRLIKLKERLVTENDYIDIKDKQTGKLRRYYTKSFWRKLATIYGFTDRVVAKEVELNDAGYIKSAYYEVEVIAPNGRSVVGIGYCDSTERGFAHPGHDIRAMAHCVPLNTEILTKRGFKLFNNVEIGDDVLSYSVEDDKCYWVPLEDKTTYDELNLVEIKNGKGFSVKCTPDHSWPVEHTTKRKHSPNRVLKKATELREGQKIILSAESEEGSAPITPREAAVLGWILTDGCIRISMIGKNGPYLGIQIDQSKEPYVEEIRTLLDGEASESTTEEYVRKFPSGQEYHCMESTRFLLKTKFIIDLLIRAGVYSESDGWVKLVCNLNHKAREAMLDAMLKGDGTIHNNTWIFTNTDDVVLEVFQVLAVLEGRPLGKLQLSSGMKRQTIRRHRYVDVSSLTYEISESGACWCPTTKYGTWIMRYKGHPMITGNTRGKNRAISDMVAGGEPIAEEMVEVVEEE